MMAYGFSVSSVPGTMRIIERGSHNPMQLVTGLWGYWVGSQSSPCEICGEREWHRDNSSYLLKKYSCLELFVDMLSRVFTVSSTVLPPNPLKLASKVNTYLKYWYSRVQCFSTFVRPRPGKFFFIRRGPGPNKFTRKYLSF